MPVCISDNSHLFEDFRVTMKLRELNINLERFHRHISPLTQKTLLKSTKQRKKTISLSYKQLGRINYIQRYCGEKDLNA